MKCPDCTHDNFEGAETCEHCSLPLADLKLPEAASDDGLSKKILTGTVLELSPRPALRVPPSATVADAVAKMRDERTGCVFVMEGEDLKGLLTERDLLARVGSRIDEARTLPVAKVMHHTFTVLDESDPVSHAFHQMAVGRYRYVPVRLAAGYGYVSARDLLRYLSSPN